MTYLKLSIEELILKKTGVQLTENFYDPFVHFFVFPTVALEQEKDKQYLLISPPIVWENHTANVSQRNARRCRPNTYDLQVSEAFTLQLNLVEYLGEAREKWEDVQQLLEKGNTTAAEAIPFKNYVLMSILIEVPKAETASKIVLDNYQLKLTLTIEKQ